MDGGIEHRVICYVSLLMGLDIGETQQAPPTRKWRGAPARELSPDRQCLPQEGFRRFPVKFNRMRAWGCWRETRSLMEVKQRGESIPGWESWDGFFVKAVAMTICDVSGMAVGQPCHWLQE